MKFSSAILLIAVAGILNSAAIAQRADDKPARATPAAAEPTVTRVYDVQDLIAPRHEFPLATSPFSLAFVTPNGRADWLQSGQGGGQLGQGGGSQGGTLFTSKSASDPLSDELLKTILDNISPESWKDMGGSIGSIRLLRGMLVITQTEANHRRIAALLGDLAGEQGGMVRVTADWLLMPSSDVPKLFKAGATTEDALSQIDPAALQNLPAGTKRFSGQTLSRNGQTVYMVSGLTRSVVTSATPVVSTGVAAYSMDVTTVGGGIALEVNSRVNWDQKAAVVTLYSTFSDPAKVADNVLPVGGGTTQPSGTQTTLLPPNPSFQPFSRVVQDMRTTIRVPLGATVVAGSLALQPETRGDDPQQQLVLIIKVTASH